MGLQTKRTLATGASLLGVVLGILLVALGLSSVNATAAVPLVPTGVSSGRPVVVDRNTWGSPDAKVNMVIYFDPLCSHCMNLYYESEAQIIQRYVQTGKVRLEARPIAFLGPESVLAGKALLAAADQGRFWDYQAAMWDAYRRGGVPAYSDSNFKAMAARLNLNAEQFNAAYDGPAKAAEITALTESSRAAGVRSVPLTIIGSQRLEGDAPLQQFVQVIERELTK
ncbi:MAG: DsbA family protein [Chloroflexota bacterium]